MTCSLRSSAISIHALREEGDPFPAGCSGGEKISIHALREEGDLLEGFLVLVDVNFYPRPPRGGRQGNFLPPQSPVQISIHALREEGDRFSKYLWGCCVEFLSTPSARRATWITAEKRRGNTNFYPRPPRGGRLELLRSEAVPLPKFLSTPSARRATHPVSVRFAMGKFLSTPSARRATNHAYKCTMPKRFLSTPSARRATNGDVTIKIAGGDFYPRPPRGGRPAQHQHEGHRGRFLSTPSARRATVSSDFRTSHVVPFLSTPSARRATRAFRKTFYLHRISIHALREEGDYIAYPPFISILKFLSTPSARRATCCSD